MIVERGQLGEAHFSECRRYRYLLTRGFARALHRVVFLMLNPSTADQDKSDPTITRCLDFACRAGRAHAWGEPLAIDIVNLYGWRSPKPADLWKQDDPIGAENDEVIDRACRAADLVVCAWGAHGYRGGRGAIVKDRLVRAGAPLHHLGLTRAGQPKHPLYLAATTPLEAWR